MKFDKSFITFITYIEQRKEKIIQYNSRLY